MQGNGLDERFNQTLQNMLTKMVKDERENWESCVDGCIYAYNSAVHESTLYTPFELMFGRKAILPIDIEMDDQAEDELIAQFNRDDDSQAAQAIMRKRSEDFKLAKANISKAQQKQKRDYDRKHAKPEAYSVGEKVLVKDFLRKKRAGGKLCTRFVGPYVILKKASQGTYCVRKISDNSETRVSGAHIKPYVNPCSHRSDEGQCDGWRYISKESSKLVEMHALLLQTTSGIIRCPSAILFR